MTESINIYRSSQEESPRDAEKRIVQSMRGTALTLLRNYGSFKSMPIREVIRRGANNFIKSGATPRPLAPIGHETYVGARVPEDDNGRIVISTWTFRDLEKTGEIYVFRDSRREYMLLEPKKAFMVDIERSMGSMFDDPMMGQRRSAMDDLLEWTGALDMLLNHAVKNPDSLMTDSPVAYKY